MRQITADEFVRFLALLSPDWDEAGRVYESLRDMLLRYFERQTLPVAAVVDQLADQTLDRAARAVERRADEGMEIFNIHAFVYGVARNILREARRKPSSYLVEDLPPEDMYIPSLQMEVDRRLETLRDALNELPESDRELLLNYYESTKPMREDLAKSRGESIAVLRVRIQRLRLRLARNIKKLGPKDKA